MSKESKRKPYEKKTTSFYDSAYVNELSHYTKMGNSFYNGKRKVTPKKAKEEPNTKNPTKISSSWTPKEIFDAFEKEVYGLQSYKQAVSIFIWKILNGYRPKGALLIVGQSGSGKTELMRVLQKLYPCMHVMDGSNAVNSSYKGDNNIQSNVVVLSKLAKEHPNMPPILVIDEFDKFVINDSHSGQENHLVALPELYRLIEGTQFVYKDDKKEGLAMVDVSDMVFIFTGSFADAAGKKRNEMGFTSTQDAKHKNLSKIPTIDEVKKLLPPELRGRIEDIILSEELNEEDYVNILKNKNYSPIVRIGNEYGLKIKASNTFITRMAKEAYESGVGVRLLNTTVMHEVNKHLFENPDVKTITLK